MYVSVGTPAVGVPRKYVALVSVSSVGVKVSAQDLAQQPFSFPRYPDALKARETCLKVCYSYVLHNVYKCLLIKLYTIRI